MNPPDRALHRQPLRRDRPGSGRYRRPVKGAGSAQRDHPAMRGPPCWLSVGTL